MPKSADAFRTISEVADWLDTPAHVLRFWESKFSQIKPVKRAGGRRYYRPTDMLLVGGIKQLLHSDGLTIKGAQKILREHGVKHVAALSQPLDTEIGSETINTLATQDISDVQVEVSVPEAIAAAEVVDFPRIDTKAPVSPPPPATPTILGQTEPGGEPDGPVPLTPEPETSIQTPNETATNTVQPIETVQPVENVQPVETVQPVATAHVDTGTGTLDEIETPTPFSFRHHATDSKDEIGDTKVKPNTPPGPGLPEPVEQTAAPKTVIVPADPDDDSTNIAASRGLLSDIANMNTPMPAAQATEFSQLMERLANLKTKMSSA